MKTKEVLWRAFWLENSKSSHGSPQFLVLFLVQTWWCNKVILLNNDTCIFNVISFCLHYKLFCQLFIDCCSRILKCSNGKSIIVYFSRAIEIWIGNLLCLDALLVFPLEIVLKYWECGWGRVIVFLITFSVIVRLLLKFVVLLAYKQIWCFWDYFNLQACQRDDS